MVRSKWRGSMTVEAAIIMPIFLVMLVTMLMFAMFIYEKSAMRSVCNQVVAEAAAIWPRGADYMAAYYANGNVLEEEKQEKIYIYRIYADYFSNLLDTEKDRKKEILKKQLAKEIVRHSFILTEEDIQTEVEFSSIIIHKQVIVSAHANYHLPFYSDQSNITAQCVISGQTELVRTVDFAADMLDGPMSKMKEQYGAVIEKLQELISKVRIEKEP